MTASRDGVLILWSVKSNTNVEMLTFDSDLDL